MKRRHRITGAGYIRRGVVTLLQGEMPGASLRDRLAYRVCGVFGHLDFPFKAGEHWAHQCTRCHTIGV